MRPLPGFGVILLAVLASCAAGSSGQGDTDGVGGGPQDAVSPPEAAPAEEVAEPPTPLPPAVVGPAQAPAALGFVGGTRFIVAADMIEDGESASFLVVDREAGETFRVLGQPMGERRLGASSFAELGVSPGAPRLELDATANGRMLVRSAGGVQLVDLGARGRMLAAWRGTPLAASLAPDGESFAVIAEGATHLVRASDGAIGTYPTSDGGSVVSWGERAATFSESDRLVRIDRATLRAASFRSSRGPVTIAASTDATTVAFATAPADGAPATVQVFDGDPGAPVLSLASPTVEDLRASADGAFVVWIERQERNDGADHGFLHAIDVAARSHARFPMLGAGCSIVPESVRSVRDGTIATDASCRLGCPSVRWSERTVTYDARSGRVISDETVETSQSWNEQVAATEAFVEGIATRLHVGHESILRGGSDTFLVGRPNGVSIASSPPVATTPLEDSAGASVDALLVSPDGKVIAGLAAGRLRAWDAITGSSLVR